MKTLLTFLVAALIATSPACLYAQRRQVTYNSQKAEQHTVLEGQTGNATVEFFVQNGITQHQVSFYSASTVTVLTTTVSAKTYGGNYTQISSSSSLSATITFSGTYSQIKVVYTAYSGSGIVEADYYGNAAATTLIADSSGTSILAATDPCWGTITTTVAISQTSDTKLISAGTGKTHICGGVIIAAAAEIVNIIEGTGSTCGSNAAALAGSTTDANGLSLAANGGFSISKPIHGLTAARDVCLMQSGSNRVSGWISYVQP